MRAEVVAKTVCPVRSCRGVLTLSAHFREFRCRLSSDCMEKCFTRLSSRVIHRDYSSLVFTHAQPEVHSFIAVWFVVFFLSCISESGSLNKVKLERKQSDHFRLAKGTA